MGVDIDPKAEDIARENAAYNGIGPDRFLACTGNVSADKAKMEILSDGGYDVVLVNIVADVIISLAPALPRFLKDTGIAITSGILDSRLPEVLAALERAGLEILEIHSQEDWRCVVAKKS